MTLGLYKLQLELWAPEGSLGELTTWHTIHSLAEPPSQGFIIAPHAGGKEELVIGECDLPELCNRSSITRHTFVRVAFCGKSRHCSHRDESTKLFLNVQRRLLTRKPQTSSRSTKHNSRSQQGLQTPEPQISPKSTNEGRLHTSRPQLQSVSLIKKTGEARSRIQMALK